MEVKYITKMLDQANQHQVIIKCGSNDIQHIPSQSGKKGGNTQ